MPNELSQLQFLKALDLTGNRMRVLPPEVAEIPEIQTISISLNPVIECIDKAARRGPKQLIEFLRSDEYDAAY